MRDRDWDSDVCSITKGAKHDCGNKDGMDQDVDSVKVVASVEDELVFEVDGHGEMI